MSNGSPLSHNSRSCVFTDADHDGGDIDGREMREVSSGGTNSCMTPLRGQKQTAALP